MNISKIFSFGLATAFALICENTNARDFDGFQNGVGFKISSDFANSPVLGSSSNTVAFETLSVRPIGGPPPPYRVTFSISMTEQAASNDLSQSISVVEYDNPPAQDASSSSGSLEFSLPSPDVAATAPRLTGDTRTAADWIGQSVYYTLCVLNNCFAANETIRPSPLAFLSATNDNIANQLKLYWAALPKDRANKSIGAGHRMTIVSQLDGTTEDRFISEVPDSQLVLFDGKPSNLLTLDQTTLTPGEAYTISIRTCDADQSACGGSKTIENLRAFAAFSKPTADAQRNITVTWQKFSASTMGYQLVRYEVDSSGRLTNPITRIVPENSDSYLDRDSRIEAGKNYLYQISACLNNSNCSSGSVIRTGDTAAVSLPQAIPDPVSFVTASDGETDVINLSWSELAPINSNFQDPGYNITIANSLTDDTDNDVRKLSYQPGPPTTIFNTGSVNGLPSGVLLNFSVQSCTDINSNSPNCSAIESDFGYSLAQFRAGSPRNGVATVNWRKFSASHQRHRLERCTDGAQCVFINDLGNVEEHEDSNVEPGTTYRYSVHACTSTQNSSCVKTGETNDVTVIGNVLPDMFENDDDPAELTKTKQLIKANVRQPRSFHTGEDVDWTKIELQNASRQLEVFTTSPFANTDTELTLFDATGKTIACAFFTPDEFTPHARLLLPKLSPGEYFLRVKQEFIGFTLNPVESYFLDVIISRGSSNTPVEGSCSGVDGFPNNAKASIVPILNLLLEE